MIHQRIKFDLFLLILTLVLILFGLIIVYDASVVQAFHDYNDPLYLFKAQCIWVVLGLICLGIFSKLNYHGYRHLALGFFLLTLFLLLIVSIPGVGFSAGGAHRWLKIGPISLQPTELIKLSTVLFFAALFEHKLKLAPFLIIISVVSVIIGIFQKDLGSMIVYALISLGMYAVSGANVKLLLALLPIGLLGFLGFVISSSYRVKRILAFMDPFSDPTGYTYHISQVLIGLGSGGFFGLGLGQSRAKFEFLPEVTTDSIFAIVGEEFGFLGATILVCLFGLLIWRGLKIASECESRFGSLIAYGLTFWLGMQAIINLSSMVSLTPLTGVPLPLISYGGSALMANMIAIGILLNISKNEHRIKH